jgi:hypothetical protein
MTTSTQNNSVLSVLAQATNNDGSRKAGVWPTKGYNMLESGEINAEIDAQGATINGKHVSTAVLTAKALQPIFEGGETLAQWLAYTSQGFVSFQQQRAATGIVQNTSKTATIDESAMLADEREAYYISMAKPQSPAIVNMLSTVNDANADIDARLSILKEVEGMLKAYKAELKKPVVLTDEQLASLALQRESERALEELRPYTLSITKTKTGIVCTFDAYSREVWIFIGQWAAQHGYLVPSKNSIKHTTDDSVDSVTLFTKTN